MEEIRKRIESFSPPRTSPASQAPPIQPTPLATRSVRDANHNTYFTGCHRHKKRERKERVKQPKSIDIGA